MDLGEKIKSLRLELNKSLKETIANLEELITEVLFQVDEVIRQIKELQDQATSRDDEPLREIPSIDTTALDGCIWQTERWRNFILNMGYELVYFGTIRKICDDATIRVKRLVHNFEERIHDVEEQVWDENHKLREDFNFKGIASAGLWDIILLHDWYACNAPGVTPEDMGFISEEQLLKFRKRCNRISYNLRKNQWSQMLSMEIERLQNQIIEIEDNLAETEYLKFNDLYGWEAKDAETVDKPWSEKDITLEPLRRIGRFDVDQLNPSNQVSSRTPKQTTTKRQNLMFKALQIANNTIAEKYKNAAEYKKDMVVVGERTIEYLKNIGLIEKPEDMEKLATRNLIATGNVDCDAKLKEIERAKQGLDDSMWKLNKQNESLRSIIDGISEAEKKIIELKDSNKKLFGACVGKKGNKQKRNRLLIQKMENESKIQELQQIVAQTRKKHLTEFDGIEKIRKEFEKLSGETMIIRYGE